MTPQDAARMVALNAVLQSQMQRMRDAHADYAAAFAKCLESHNEMTAIARKVLDAHCREAEDKIVKLRPSVVLPTERQT